MSKLYLEQIPLQNIILPELRNLQNKLNDIKESLKAINSPVGHQSLNHCFNKINRSQTNLKNIENWLLESMKQYNEVMLKMNQEVNLIPKSDLKKRESIIR